MRSWRWLAFCILALSAAGCCRLGGRSANAALEQENRQLEDRLYQTQHELEKCQQQLERARSDAQNARGRKIGPAEASAGPELQAPETLQAPSIEMPSEPEPSGTVPDRLMLPEGDSAPPFNPPTPRPTATSARRGSAPARRIADPAASRNVASVTLSQTLTGGFDVDRQPGHDGIIAVIEPRDSQGRLLEVPASVSVVILDPALSGKEARLGRWDYSPEQVARVLAQNQPGMGIPLEVLWPTAPPQHSTLHLYIRYTTADGRKLETNRVVEVRLPGTRPPPTLAAAPGALSQNSAPANGDSATGRSSATASAGASGWRGIPLEYRRRDPPPSVAAQTTPAPSPEGPAAEVSSRTRPVWSPTR